MAQWIGFTNQKLYQCRLLIAESEKARDSLLASALEAAALHLWHDAWRSYLQELGEMVAFREPVQSLADLMQRSPMVTGEMRELSMLADNGFSWLAQCLTAVADLNRQAPVKVQPADDALLISASAEPSSQVAVWWQSLSDLIDAQRENRQEH